MLSPSWLRFLRRPFHAECIAFVQRNAPGAHRQEVRPHLTRRDTRFRRSFPFLAFLSLQLGLGDKANRGGTALSMGDGLPYVNLGAGEAVRKVVAANHFTCAWLEDDSVK